MANKSPEEDAPGIRIAQRRTRLGMTVNQLSKESGVDRMTITKLEQGGSRHRDSTVGQLTRTLDRLEHEMGLDLPIAASELEREGLVEISATGDFGVSLIVKGPVRDIAELEATAARLIARIRAERDESQQ